MQTSLPPSVFSIDMNHDVSKDRIQSSYASNTGMRVEDDDHSAKDRVKTSLIEPSVELTPDLKKPMPVDYLPSPHSVLTGRGKFCTEAIGSKRLRVIASKFLDQYSKADTKQAKSDVVSKIIEIIEKNCPSGGAFVKLEKGRWWEVDKSAAREKVGYVLRNLLHDKYRSSSKSKAKTRRLRLSREGQNKNNSDIDDTLSHSSSESNLHLTYSITGSTALTEDFTTPHAAVASLPAHGYAAAATVGMPGNQFLGTGAAFPGQPLHSTGPAAAGVGNHNFPAHSFHGIQAPQMTNLSRSQTWPRRAQNQPPPNAPPLPSSTGSSPMPSLRHGAQPAPTYGGGVEQQFWRQGQLPLTSSSERNNSMSSMMGSDLLEEALGSVGGGNSAPIDEGDLSSIFD